MKKLEELLTEEEKEAIDFFRDFKPKIFWKEPIKVENEYVMKDDVYLKNKIDIILNLITKLQKENEELEKHDYRNIKIDEKDELKSPSIPKERLNLMNLGIALYLSIHKIFEDESEDIDI